LYGRTFSGHRDLHPIALQIGLPFDLHVEIDRAHDAVAVVTIGDAVPIVVAICFHVSFFVRFRL
jgi:hypothetical protein